MRTRIEVTSHFPHPDGNGIAFVDIPWDGELPRRGDTVSLFPEVPGSQDLIHPPTAVEYTVHSVRWNGDGRWVYVDLYHPAIGADA